jgi:hypothetical protein
MDETKHRVKVTFRRNLGSGSEEHSGVLSEMTVRLKAFNAESKVNVLED